MTDLGSVPGNGRIDLAQELAFDLGTMRVRPAELIVEINGTARELQPRVMQVLVALARERPAVVSRDRLAEQCWDGRIVGHDALDRCLVALRHLAKHTSPEPFAIETIRRVGYSLIENPSADPKRAAIVARQTVRKRIALAAVLLPVGIAAALAFALPRLGDQTAPVSIAVLPFRNLSDNNAFFAEGVGEEIMGQLAREPAFRVASSASSAQFSGPSDPRKVGQALGVNYLLEGSVRPDKNRVRINAALIRTTNGRRVWPESYDRKLDDILAIQGAIGQAVATGLKRKLVHYRSEANRAVNGQAYVLYLNARGLLRSQSPQVGADAVADLKESIRLDPSFAPAWSSLAEALQLDAKVHGADALIDALPRAEVAARRALSLDPELAQAHGVLGQILPIREGRVQLIRAAQIDPTSGEGLAWVAEAHYVSGEYGPWLESLRQAHATDHLWTFPLRALIDVSSVMDRRPVTEAIVRQGYRDDPILQEFALARVAWTYGDFSEAARRWTNVANNPESRWAAPARLSLEDLSFLLKLSSQRPTRSPTPRPGRQRWGPGIWMAVPPSPEQWRVRNRSAAAALVNLDENIVAAKLMLNVGRARELTATYDSPTGLLNIKQGAPIAVCLEESAITALALRRAGRTGEADALLARTNAILGALYRGGAVPAWLDWEAASVWALQGKSGLAIEALERSLRRGWGNGRRGDLPNLEEEPALRSLLDDPRFKTVLKKYKAHYASERAQTARILKVPA